MKKSIIHVCMVLCVFSLLNRVDGETLGKKNVLFIAIDDLNDYISPMDHHPGVKTPNFEKLAKRSVLFLNAHCAAPACHPSRVAVLTGVHPAKSGIYTNLFKAHGPRWRDESPMLKDAVVLSQHFRNHGYRAVGGGKLFHTLQWTPGDSQNDPAAWDEYRGDPLDPLQGDWPRPDLTPDADVGIKEGRPLGPRQLFGTHPLAVSDEETGDHKLATWAIEQLQKKHDQPLFLAVGFFRPHIPFEVPQSWFDMHPLAELKVPHYKIDDLLDAHPHNRISWHEWVVQNQLWEKFVQGYLASMSYVDHQVGRLLTALDESPNKENTIIVLWTDHGFHLGEKDNWEKFTLWTQTTRVPLFIHAPGISQDGKVCKQPVTLTDLYPTLCDLCEIPVPGQCTGKSVKTLLENPGLKRSDCSLTSYYFAGEKSASHAVSDERYRYIKYGNEFEELYDCESDPDEFTNLAGDKNYEKILQQMRVHIPDDAAPNRLIPRDSKFNQK